MGAQDDATERRVGVRNRNQCEQPHCTAWLSVVQFVPGNFEQVRATRSDIVAFLEDSLR